MGPQMLQEFNKYLLRFEYNGQYFAKDRQGLMIKIQRPGASRRNKVINKEKVIVSYNLLRLNQEKTEYLNRPITLRETKIKETRSRRLYYRILINFVF